MKRIKVWPHATLIIVGCALVAGLAALLWTKYERSALAKEMPMAARIERLDGQVGLNHSLDNAANAQWFEATANTPISVGDRVFTRDNSRTEIGFTGRNFAMLEPNTSLDVLDLSDQRTQVALRDGSALFEIGALASGDLFEVATPCGAVDLEQPGVYRIVIDNNGNAVASTLSGSAQVVGQLGTGKIEKGEELTVSCQGGPNAVLSRVDPGQAGALLDSYYSYRYPRTYDGRYRNYYTYLEDPYYYDPYRREISYQYVSDYIPGVGDLDDYGNWEYVNDYGYCWHPYAGSGWAPYQSGYWDAEYPFGLTWISYEPWGYAPYHYGRWAYVTDRWFWIPDPVRTRPVYSPALVAFIPVSQPNYIAWVPLGPGDPYAPRYYDRDWHARVLGREEFRDHLFNQNVAGGVTVVSARDFNRKIDDRVIVRTDSREFAKARPVFDPMSVDPLRRAAFATREARHRIDVPPGLAQRINNTPVLTSAAPATPLFKRDLARALRVESVPDKVRNQKLQFRDERSTSAAAQAGQNQIGANARVGGAGNVALDQARERQMAELSVRALSGDRGARTQLHVLQRQQLEARRAERVTAQEAQGEQVRAQMQTQRAQAMAERQQQQLQRAALHRQQQVQREAGRQQAIVTQQQRRVIAPPRVEAERVGNKVRPAPREMRPQPRPRENRPPVSYQQPQRVMRPERKPPQVQAQPQRLSPVRVKPPQSSTRLTDPPQWQSPQPRKRVDYIGPPVRAGNPPAVSPPQGKGKKHP